MSEIFSLADANVNGTCAGIIFIFRQLVNPTTVTYYRILRFLTTRRGVERETRLSLQSNSECLPYISC